MFNKYWREYPWFFQLLLFIIMMFVCGTFFLSVTGFGISKLSAYTAADIQQFNINSPAGLRITALILQAILSISTFIVPVLLFVYAAHPRRSEYLGLRKPGKSIHWLLVFFLIVGFQPISSGLAGLIEQLPLGDDIRKTQDAFKAKQKAYTNLQTPTEFITAIFVFSVIPAIGEELMFRGIMMRFSAKRTRGILWPIIISAVFFALVHYNITGFVSILLSGILLGFIYYLTGSSLLSMFAHFIANAMQLTVLYFSKDNAAIQQIMDSNEIPWGLFAGGIILFSISLYLLWKYRTPLQPDWANDFNAEEMAEKVNERNNIF